MTPDPALDLLDLEFINSLPQPLSALVSGDWWPVADIEVQTGLLRIDVCGMLDVLHIGSVLQFRDLEGRLHDPDSFYLEARGSRAALAPP